jgi:hypothetical protein
MLFFGCGPPHCVLLRQESLLNHYNGSNLRVLPPKNHSLWKKNEGLTQRK